jgi:hypothetical protein
MGFMVDRVWQWEMFVSKQFGFSLSVSLHQCSILFFILILFISEGQADETWEPANKSTSVLHFEGGLDRKVLSHVVFLAYHMCG